MVTYFKSQVCTKKAIIIIIYQVEKVKKTQ